jgi:hypothetical protein
VGAGGAPGVVGVRWIEGIAGAAAGLRWIVGAVGVLNPGADADGGANIAGPAESGCTEIGLATGALVLVPALALTWVLRMTGPGAVAPRAADDLRSGTAGLALLVFDEFRVVALR